jgi:hypothetical protein
MRTMARISIPVEAGNKAIQGGSLPKVMQQAIERWKPEAAYFTTFDGKRTAFFVFNFRTRRPHQSLPSRSSQSSMQRWYLLQ